MRGRNGDWLRRCLTPRPDNTSSLHKSVWSRRGRNGTAKENTFSVARAGRKEGRQEARCSGRDSQRHDHCKGAFLVNHIVTVKVAGRDSQFTIDDLRLNGGRSPGNSCVMGRRGLGLGCFTLSDCKALLTGKARGGGDANRFFIKELQSIARPGSASFTPGKWAWFKTG